MNTKPYQSINCDFYDRLEEAATLKKECIIDFFDAKMEEHQVVNRIKNLFTRNKEEFMELENGTLIRLDQIIAINGEKLTNAC